jgi:solute carrier family 25 S-adenosylmethionine transporter 26
MDTAKTLRQSNPTQFASVRSALLHLLRASGAYRGCVPAALGAIPSSALYFGAYEVCKQTLERKLRVTETEEKKWWIHGLAAAAGNTISSTVFVPKEVLKQQLQYRSSASFQQVLWEILQTKGIRGLYVGYQATLMRNIPSAMIRFVLYEELKQWWSSSSSSSSLSTESGKHGILQGRTVSIPPPVALFGAGAIAGAVASGVMTPIDVIKTRLATGTCPIGVQNCVQHVLTEMGWRGLYAGAASRMMWSGAFSAIGFGTFELVKTALGVSHMPTSTPTTTTPAMATTTTPAMAITTFHAPSNKSKEPVRYVMIYKYKRGIQIRVKMRPCVQQG